MRIAYLVMLHDRPEQAVRLLRILDRPQHTLLVHVDRRADTAVRRTMQRAVDALPNASLFS